MTTVRQQSCGSSAGFAARTGRTVMCNEHERQSTETAVSCAPTELAEVGQTGVTFKVSDLLSVAETDVTFGGCFRAPVGTLTSRTVASGVAMLRLLEQYEHQEASPETLSDEERG